MSLGIMLLLMVLAAAVGGVVNFLLPANTVDNKSVKPLWQCAVLGLGATLLVPIFLELAQSKLMENISIGFTSPHSSTDTIAVKADTILITIRPDSVSKSERKDTTVRKAAKEVKTTPTAPVKEDIGKNYLLWLAYCVLAAAAGFRFIDMIINKVGAAKEMNEVKTDVQQVKKAFVKQVKTDVVTQDKTANLLLQNQAQSETVTLAADSPPIPIELQLPPVTHWNDPQKNRFGGRPQRNNRLLEVRNIKELTGTGGLCQFELQVKSMDTKKLLTGEVIFYLHNTFNPSIIAVQVKDGKALLLRTNVYGAFTVGAIADGGKTLLELDLAEDKDFPQQFRDR